jgi:chemotaxis protein MotB
MAAGGGAWKVAYADFVTAMMAFFLVMWIIAQNNQVRRAIARYFNDPRGLTEKPGTGSPMLPDTKPGETPGPSILPSAQPGAPGGSASIFQKRTKDIPYDSKKPDKNLKELLTDKSRLYVIHNGGRNYAGTIVLFPQDSSHLDAEAKDRLIRLLDDIRGKPNKLEVRGHATRQPSARGSPGENPWELSYARCQAVMNFLEKRGVEPERIRLSQSGPYEPYTLQEGSAKQAYNSRVEVYVLDEYAEDLMGTPEERAKRFIRSEQNRISAAKP